MTTTNAFKFVSRREGLTKSGEGTPLDVSSSDELYGKQYHMSPFSEGPNRIPIPAIARSFPGYPLTSRTVEAVWQGLKVIDSTIFIQMFEWHTPHKRKPEAGEEFEGWYCEGDVVDVVTARLKLYIPAYLYHWKHNVPDEVKDDLVRRALAGERFRVFDYNSNGDIFNPEKGYAHAHLVTFLLNGRLAKAQGLPEPKPFWIKETELVSHE